MLFSRFWYNVRSIGPSHCRLCIKCLLFIHLGWNKGPRSAHLFNWNIILIILSCTILTTVFWFLLLATFLFIMIFIFVFLTNDMQFYCSKCILDDNNDVEEEHKFHESCNEPCVVKFELWQADPISLREKSMKSYSD